MRHGDAIGERGGEPLADVGKGRGVDTLIRPFGPPSPARGRRDAPLSRLRERGWGEGRARAVGQAPREAARVLGARRAVAAESVEPMGQIDGLAAEPALGQRDGDLGRQAGASLARGVDHHAREARRQGEPGNRPAFPSDAPVAVERAQRSQQRARLAERGARRGIEKGERGGIAHPPRREIEREAGEIGGKNFRRRVGQEAAIARFFPQTIAYARLDASGAPAPLVGVGARHPHRLQPRQPDVRLEAGDAHQAAVDDDAHALDGQRSLGDRGRQHDLAPPRGGGRNRLVLRPRVHRAIKRRDVDAGIFYAARELARRRA